MNRYTYKAKRKELISDQEICIKNTLQSLNEWKEYAETLEELIDKIKEMCIETEKHNDNCSGALDYEIIESNILDLIKEYENND